jgi:hypothetical protein
LPGRVDESPRCQKKNEFHQTILIGISTSNIQKESLSYSKSPKYKVLIFTKII